MQSFWKNHMWTVIVGLMIVIFLGATIYGNVKQRQSTSSEASTSVATFPTSTTKTFNEADQPFLGEANAPHTITIFFDYLCPHCADWEKEVFPSVNDKLIQTHQARLVFVNYPFLYNESYSAAVAGEYMHANHPNAFATFHQSLFANSTTLTIDHIIQLAKQADPSVDETKLKEAIRTNAFADDVLADKAYAKQKNVQGTPTILVDGKQVTDVSFAGIQAALK